MNKQQFIRNLSTSLSIPQEECRKALNTTLELLEEELRKGNTISFHGFGSFGAWEQTERIGRNPRNGKPYPIRPRTSVKFKPGKTLLEKLNWK